MYFSKFQISFQSIFKMSYNSNCGQHSQQCLFRTKSESFSVLCGCIERCGESTYSGRGLVYTPLNKYSNTISVMTYIRWIFYLSIPFYQVGFTFEKISLGSDEINGIMVSLTPFLQSPFQLCSNNVAWQPANLPSSS